MSVRSIAEQFGMNESTLRSRAAAEKWLKPSRKFRAPPSRTEAVRETPESTAETARLLHEVIHRLAQGDIDERMVKLLADALSQVHKIQITSPQTEQTTQDGFFIPFSEISAWARMEIQRILIEDKRRRERVG
jgi:hypothetical protein